jgi:very-short-patch-repair endonuclease
VNAYHRIVTALCDLEAWPRPEAEVRFAPPRRWRFDLCWPTHKLAVEVQGGVFVRGRHSRGAAQVADMEKFNTAQMLGWRVLQVTPQQVTDGTLIGLLRQVFTEGRVA